MIKLMRNDY